MKHPHSCFDTFPPGFLPLCALLNTRTISGNKEDPKPSFHHKYHHDTIRSHVQNNENMYRSPGLVGTLYTPVNISEGRFIFVNFYIGTCLKV